MDGMREIRFFSKALFVGFKPRKESLLYVFNSIPYCGSEDISWGSRKNPFIEIPFPDDWHWIFLPSCSVSVKVVYSSFAI